MKKIFVILFAVAAVFGLASCSSSSPSGTVKAYYKALQAGEYEKALSYTDITDQEEIQQQVAKFKSFDVKIIDFEILSENISEDGNTAVVEVKQSSTSAMNSNPEESVKKLELVKVDGKWKIHV